MAIFDSYVFLPEGIWHILEYIRIQNLGLTNHKTPELFTVERGEVCKDVRLVADSLVGGHIIGLWLASSLLPDHLFRRCLRTSSSCDTPF